MHLFDLTAVKTVNNQPLMDRVRTETGQIRTAAEHKTTGQEWNGCRLLTVQAGMDAEYIGWQEKKWI